MYENLIAALDPAGVPGPVWLFQALLVFTFFVHLLFMNLTLGGTLLAAVAHSLSGGRLTDPRGALAKRLVAVNGFGISMTITTGVAPLLFIQLLYQQYFYTATILIGWAWFSLLGFLTVGYYAVYVYKMKKTPDSRHGGGFWLWLAALFFLVVAAIQVAVHLVHVQPSTWPDITRNALAVLLDPTFVPRWLHFVLAGISASALITAWWAARQADLGVDSEVNSGIARYAWRWALWSLAALVVDGFVLLAVLPRTVLLAFMRGGAATMAPLTLAIVVGVALLIAIARTVDPVGKPRVATGALAAVGITIAIMTVSRHQIRDLYLAHNIDFAAVRVVPQWGNFVLFALLLVGGLATVYFMVRRVLNEPACGDDAA